MKAVLPLTLRFQLIEGGLAMLETYCIVMSYFCYVIVFFHNKVPFLGLKDRSRAIVWLYRLHHKYTGWLIIFGDVLMLGWMPGEVGVGISVLYSSRTMS